jgi:hypothetical protein
METYQPNERFNRAEDRRTALPEALGLLAVLAAAVMFLLFVAVSVATNWQIGTSTATAMEIVSTTGGSGPF